MQVWFWPRHPPSISQAPHYVRWDVTLFSSHFCFLRCCVTFCHLLFLFCILRTLSLQVLLARTEWGWGNFSLDHTESSLPQIVFLGRHTFIFWDTFRYPWSRTCAPTGSIGLKRGLRQCLKVGWPQKIAKKKGNTSRLCWLQWQLKNWQPL